MEQMVVRPSCHPRRTLPPDSPPESERELPAKTIMDLDTGAVVRPSTTVRVRREAEGPSSREDQAEPASEACRALRPGMRPKILGGSVSEDASTQRLPPETHNLRDSSEVVEEELSQPRWEDVVRQLHGLVSQAALVHERELFDLRSEVARLRGETPPSPLRSSTAPLYLPAARALQEQAPCVQVQKQQLHDHRARVSILDPESEGLDHRAAPQERGILHDRGSIRASTRASISSTATFSVDEDGFTPGGYKASEGDGRLPIYSSRDDEEGSEDPFHHVLACQIKPFWRNQLKKSGGGRIFPAAKPDDARRERRRGMTAQHISQAPAKKACICIADPSSRWRLVWDLMGSWFLFLDMVMIPLQAFGEHVDNEDVKLMALTLVTSLYWTGDMFFSFMVGYHVKGVVQMNPKKIAIHYLQTWFALDATLATIDWSFIIMGLGQQASALRAGKTLSRGMRVLRLLRIVKMHAVISDIMERIRSEYVRTIFQIMGLVFFIVMLNHIAACGWYGLTYISDADTNWVQTFLPEDATLSYRYATSLHWSLTQFTPAAMEVYAKNEYERVYSVCVLLFALITFSSFVSSITNLMNHLRNINSQRLEQQKKLRIYLHQHGISSQLVNRVWHYLHQREVVNSAKVRTKEADVPVLHLLPASMRAELRFQAYAGELRQHPFFYHYGYAETGALLQICDSAIDEVSLLARQELFSNIKGEVVKMFFVMEGLMEYNLPCLCAAGRDLDSQYSLGSQEEGDDDGGAVATRSSRGRRDTVRPGQWSCEAALWAQRVELASPFVAKEKSELLIVNTSEFQNIIMMYEGTRHQVAQYAQTFTEFQPQMTKCRWLACMCNNYSEIQDLVHRVFDYKEVQNRGTLRRTLRGTLRVTRNMRPSMTMSHAESEMPSEDVQL